MLLSPTHKIALHRLPRLLRKELVDDTLCAELRYLDHILIELEVLYLDGVVCLIVKLWNLDQKEMALGQELDVDIDCM